MLPFSDVMEHLPLPAFRRSKKARAELDAIIYGMIDERRKNPSDRGDLLSMLLMAQDEEADGAGMTDQQVRDEAMTIFLAGHETTANALAWTWYSAEWRPRSRGAAARRGRSRAGRKAADACRYSATCRTSSRW